LEEPGRRGIRRVSFLLRAASAMMVPDDEA
jgi:hypothetical protein